LKGKRRKGSRACSTKGFGRLAFLVLGVGACVLGPRPALGQAASADALVVRWEPASPTDGTALAVTVSVPADEELLEVEARLDDRPLRMGRLAGSWFGLIALPTDRSGPVELVVSATTAGGQPMNRRWTVPVRPRAYSETELSVAPRFTSPPADVLERIERERELVRSTLRQVSPAWLLDGNFVRPRSTRITSPFGQKRIFNGEVQSRHWGVDLAGDVGAPVRVAGRGRVAIARELYYAGNAVYVDHGLGVFSGYYHLSQIDVGEGDLVETGQVIGRVGATGRVTGPHLHWSFFAGGERLDASTVLEIRVPQTPAAVEREAAEDEPAEDEPPDPEDGSVG
jgi:murein DD-endopeptidase MepM/ murein hydrolase activator NlpD